MSIAYKLFRVKKTRPRELFPLYVLSTNATPMHEWIPAECGIQKENGKVKSKLGDLCFRPGWHLSDTPLATHMGYKDKSGKISFLQSDRIWCECEYSDQIDYSLVAKQNGIDENGKFDYKKAYLKEIPINGCYRFKTCPTMLGEWIIAGEIKVNRLLTDEEVERICKGYGYESLPRRDFFNYEDYGFLKEDFEEVERSETMRRAQKKFLSEVGRKIEEKSMGYIPAKEATQVLMNNGYGNDMSVDEMNSYKVDEVKVMFDYFSKP